MDEKFEKLKIESIIESIIESGIESMIESRMKLRPHHPLCLILFNPEGHSEMYTKIMNIMIEYLVANPAQEIILSPNLDLICDFCPHKNAEKMDNPVCIKEEKVQVITGNILKLTGLKVGEQMPWENLRQRIVDNIITNGKFSDACGSCSYFEQCKFEASKF